MNRIKSWWRFKGRYFLKDFKQGIRNLWRWFPTIWKDRDWDAYFIYEILRVKLENQAYYIGNKDRHVEAKRDAERMLLCARLIKIQQDDLYHMEYLDYIKESYEFVATDDTNKWYSMESKLLNDDLDTYFALYPKQYKRALSGKLNRFQRPAFDRDRQLIAMEIALDNQERSRKLLFKIISQHIERWWD